MKRSRYNPFGRWSTGFVLGLMVLSGSASSRAEQTGLQFFESKIRPALVLHCYECHSVSDKKPGGNLFLDSREGTLRGGESGPALVPGKPSESLLIQAIQRTHDDLVMPPDEKPALPEATIHQFVRWVEMGAPDPRSATDESSRNEPDADWWSFQPVQDPSLPEIENTGWPRDPLDHFIMAKLESEGLRPTGEAPPEFLARRIYSDLVGLAPSMDALRTFVSSYHQNPQGAVAELVDELLASPHFGERWGRHWLDVARYGESNGNDGLGRNATFPHAWRYRDYVVAALNRDVPYNRFLKEQIAGDLLPSSNLEERNRQLVATGFLALGAKPAAAMNVNFAMDVVDDQINTVSTAVMALSVSCARCHDHKHDPISTRDYYALAGIFKSTETLWGKAANEKLTAPATPLHDLNPSKDSKEQKPEPAPAFPEGYADAIAALNPIVHAPLDRKPGNIILEEGVDTSEKAFGQLNEGRIRIEQPVPADNYTVSLWFRNDLANESRPITAYLFSLAVMGDKEQKGDHLGIGGTHETGRAGKLFIWNGTEKNENARGKKTLLPGTWNHIVFTRSGKSVKLYLNGEDEPETSAEMEVAAPDGRVISIGARNDRFAPLQGHLAHLAVFDRALTAEETRQLHAASGRPPGTREGKVPAFAMGVRDRPAPEDCKINIDGNSQKLGPRVPRGFLPACKSSFSPPTVGTGSSGRLQLADWLTRGDHPLTARVMVNRVWLHLFGRGIVSTPDDFGLYGARPSHPHLLDHLSHRFMEDGWSLKKLIRTIVLSRSYQLDSRCEDLALLNADPDNRLIGRHSRRRLDAESVRDRILQAAGNLDLKPPEGSAIGQLDILLNWPPGEAKYLHEPSNHRSLYLCMLRNSPPPDLAAFNLPDDTAVSGQREVSTPPTQALFFLNNTLVVEQASSLAQDLLSQDEISDAARVEVAYHRALQREPTAADLSRALGHVRELESELSGADATRRAWASFCQALLASNEFRYID